MWIYVDLHFSPFLVDAVRLAFRRYIDKDSSPWQDPLQTNPGLSDLLKKQC